MSLNLALLSGRPNPEKEYNCMKYIDNFQSIVKGPLNKTPNATGPETITNSNAHPSLVTLPNLESSLIIKGYNTEWTIPIEAICKGNILLV